ncbi:MAG: hypothetical protein EZS28_047847, partial [Streblomastix strix]
IAETKIAQAPTQQFADFKAFAAAGPSFVLLCDEIIDKKGALIFEARQICEKQVRLAFEGKLELDITKIINSQSKHPFKTKIHFKMFLVN